MYLFVLGICGQWSGVWIGYIDKAARLHGQGVKDYYIDGSHIETWYGHYMGSLGVYISLLQNVLGT